MKSPTIVNTPANESRTSTLVYEKSFAVRGMICGVLVLLGSPFFVLLFHEAVETTSGGLWTRMFPDWVAPVMLCIGMGGGVLTIVLSVLFGLLIPTRVTRGAPVETTRPETSGELSQSPTS